MHTSTDASGLELPDTVSKSKSWEVTARLETVRTLVISIPCADPVIAMIHPDSNPIPGQGKSATISLGSPGFQGACTIVAVSVQSSGKPPSMAFMVIETSVPNGQLRA